MQTRTPFLDDLARLASGAVGTAQTVKEEMETLLRARMERWAADMAFATREEVDAAMTAALASDARIAALAERVAELERAMPAAGGAGLPSTAPPAAAGRSAQGNRPRRRRWPAQPAMACRRRR